MSTPKVEQPRIVTRDEWTAARKKHLAKEKEFTRLRDELSRQRRELPWVRIEKDYTFETPDGLRTLPDLFGGRSQLIVYHFMFGPGWEEGCRSCSMMADQFDGIGAHLKARDVSLVVVSRAPLAELTPFKTRMGWTFDWVSSHGTDFNRDFNVSFTPDELEKGEMYYNFGMTSYPAEEAHGLSVLAKNDAGEIFRTYSTYGRGLDLLLGVYNFLDLVPKGRDEDDLEYSMGWVRHHDSYEKGD